MKKIIFSAATAALMMLATSCENANVAPTEGSRTGFALSFFQNVNKTAEAADNVVVSPYSAGVALSMLMQGAEGQTKVELDNALNGCSFTAVPLSSGDTVVVKSANSLWVDDDFSIRNHYISLLEKEYDALAVTLNFADPATLHAINNWCSEHTDGKVTEVLQKLSPEAVMVLANALYFKAPWLEPFNADLTRDDVFHGTAGDSSVKMMYRKGHYMYAEYEGAQMIELPYEGERYSMYVVLPPENMKTSDLSSFMNEAVYQSALKLMTPQQVRLSLPKMRLETSLKLDPALKAMGVRTAYTPGADFKGISAMGPLVLDEVAQKCYIDVTESGTEAAAVTVVTIALTSARPDMNLKVMKVDRPFIFLIADKEQNYILFAGRIVNL